MSMGEQIQGATTMHSSSRGFGIAVATGLTASLVWTIAAAESEIRPLSGFSAVAVGGGISLTLRQGEEYRVEVEKSGGSPDDIVTTVEDGTLTIRQSRTSGWFDWFANYSADVTLPDLTAIHSSGGSDVRIEGTIAGERLVITASGGSEVTGAIDVADLEASTSGGADLRLSGSAVSAKIQASGGAEIDARELRTVQADIQTSGGADTSVAVSERLVAQASGGSDIFYSGEPTTDINVSGGAEVTRR
jgi:hypothetical protein